MTMTIIAAPPRTGKSQYAVSKMLEFKKENDKLLAAGKPTRNVYVTNFNQTDEQRAYTGVSVWPVEMVDRWWDDMPSGSIWIIDEAKDVGFGQRGKDKRKPEYIDKLSVHGHHDLDIYFICQDPMQLDVDIRRLINIQLYMTRPLNMRRAVIYTFRGYQQIPSDAWRRSQALKQAESKKKFSYSKKYQQGYISATAHEAIKLRFPPKLLLLPVLVGVVVWLLMFAWNRLMGEKDEPASSATGAVAAAVTGAQAPTAATPAAGAGVLSGEEWSARFKPRVPGVAHSAPAYDSFTVQDYPRTLCIIVGSPGDDECKCYTQQVTRLAVEDDMCRTYVTNGAFDPYRKPQEMPSTRAEDKSATDAPQSAATATVGQGGASPPMQVGSGSDLFARSPGYGSEAQR
jgi:zona occludens toxin